MCAETLIGLCMLGLACGGYVIHLIASRINWAMIYYKMCGGK